MTLTKTLWVANQVLAIKRAVDSLEVMIHEC